jgi:hypothetical protein
MNQRIITTADELMHAFISIAFVSLMAGLAAGWLIFEVFP